MIEFDVDMGYLLEEGELDCVILNDENGEHEPMEFRPSGGECEMVRVSNTRDTRKCSACGKLTCFDHPLDRDQLSYCPKCGARIRKAVKHG